MADRHIGDDALTKDGSSVLGKYIIGAKNNFRGFNSRQDDKNTTLKVTVHHGEEGVNKEKADSEVQQESYPQPNQVDECGADGSKQVKDCEVAKMEEGRANAEQWDKKELEKEKAKPDKSENGDSEVKEEVTEGTSFNNVEEKVKVDTSQDEKDKKRKSDVGSEVTENPIETSPEHIKSSKVSFEVTETKKMIDKFEDIELKERKVEERWMNDRKFDRNVAEKAHVRESNGKPEKTKVIPSPTGSSSSQDTGFGSQDGEGSLDDISGKT